jgi:hypothetical protein
VVESRREKSAEASEDKGVAVRPLRKRVWKGKEVKELNEIKEVEEAACATVWRGWWLRFKENVTTTVPSLSRNIWKWLVEQGLGAGEWNSENEIRERETEGRGKANNRTLGNHKGCGTRQTGAKNRSVS